MPSPSIGALSRREYSPANDSLHTATSGSTEQTILITDIISEGPIAGLVEGGVSVFLNNDPLQTNDQAAYSAPEGVTCSLNSGSSSVTVDTKGNSFNVSTSENGKKYLCIYDAYSLTVTSGQVTPINDNGAGYFSIPLGGSAPITRTAGASLDDAWNHPSADLSYYNSSWKVANNTVMGRLKLNSGRQLDGVLTAVHEGDQTAKFIYRNRTGSYLIWTDADMNGSTTHTLDLDIFLEIASISGTTITLSTNSPTTKSDAKFSITSALQDTTTQAPNSSASNQQLEAKYPGSGYNFAPGNLDQPALPTIEGTGTSTVAIPAPAGPLEEDVAKVFTASGAQASLIDEVKIIINYASGLYGVDEDDASKLSAGAGYQIELSVDRGTGEEYQILEGNSTFQNKTCFGHGGRYLTPTSFEFRINLETFQPFNGFKMRITRLTKHEYDDGNPIGIPKWPGLNMSGDSKHKIVGGAAFSAILGIIKEKLNFPYTAYANVRFSSKSFQNLPTRTYECQGLKVLVPSNYVTREENNGTLATYKRNVSTGAVETTNQLWDGNFRSDKIYTDNPAWVFYDILVNNRYGLGQYVKSTDIDKYALYKISKHCDELVPDGKGGTEPRFRANIYLTKATDAYKVLKDIATIFRAMLYWSDSQFLAVIDDKREPVYTFSQSNVIDGKFNYETTGDKTRANQIIVSWNNPEADYKLQPIIVEDRENQIKTGIVKSEKAVAFGCTSEGQAIRYGRWKLWTAINQTNLVTFETSINAAFLGPGDIINIQDEADFTIPFSGRVYSCTSSHITLDRHITTGSGGDAFPSGFTYTISVIIPKRSVVLNQDSATVNVSGGTANLTRGQEVTTANTISGSTTTLTTLLNADEDVTKKNIESALDSSGNILKLQYLSSTVVEERTLTVASLSTSDGRDIIPISSAFSETPANSAIWAIKKVSSTTSALDAASYKQYKILVISESGKSGYGIIAVEYFESKFDAVDGEFTTAVPDIVYPDEGSGEVPAPKNLRILRDPLYQKEGEELIVAWDEPDAESTTSADSNYEHTAEYVVSHSFGIETGYNTEFRTNRVKRWVRFNNVRDGRHWVGVQTVSKKGRYSGKAIAEIDVSDIYKGEPRRYGMWKGGYSTCQPMVINSGSEKGIFKFVNSSFVAAPFNNITNAKRNTSADADSYSISCTELANNSWPSTAGDNDIYDWGYIMIDFSKLDASSPNANALKLVLYKQDTTYNIAYWYDAKKYMADNSSIWTSLGNCNVVQGSRKITASSSIFGNLKVPEIVYIGTFYAKVAYVESETVLYVDRPWTAASANNQAAFVQELDIDYRNDFLVGVVSYHAGGTDDDGNAGRYGRGGGVGITSFLTIEEELASIGRAIVVQCNVDFLNYQADNSQTTSYSNIQLTLTAVNFQNPAFNVTGAGFSQVNTSADGTNSYTTSGSGATLTKTIHSNSSDIAYSTTPLLFDIKVREALDPDNTNKQINSTFSIGKLREGQQGSSAAVVYLYTVQDVKPAATTAIKDPNEDSNFPTVTAKLSGTGGGSLVLDGTAIHANGGVLISGQASGWYVSPQAPTGTQKQWVVAASANGTGTTDTILRTEWTVPTQFSGADGLSGLSVALVSLYKATSSDASPSSSMPGASIWAFDTSTFTSGPANSWSLSSPTLSESYPYIWKTTAVAKATTLSSGTTANIAANDWSTPAKVHERVPGPAGTAAKKEFVGTMYYTSAVQESGAGQADWSTPSKPSGTITFRFSDKKFSDSGATYADTVDSWSFTTPSFAPYNGAIELRWYALTVTAESDTGGGDLATTANGNLVFGNPVAIHTFDGVVAFTDLSTDKRGTTVIHGDNISTGIIRGTSFDSNSPTGLQINLDAAGTAKAIEAKTSGTHKFYVQADGTAFFAGTLSASNISGEMTLGQNSGDKITVGANDNIIIDGDAKLITIQEDNGTDRVRLGKLS